MFSPAGRFILSRALLHYCWPISSRGAAAYQRLRLCNTAFIAVVGSFGKTTATRAITVAVGLPLGRDISNNAMGRLPMKIFRVSPHAQVAVFEIGIERPGQMRPVARLLKPRVAVVMSIGSEHNRSLGTLENTRREKAEMVKALPEDGVAILNGDDENVLWMAGQTRARVVTFGFGEANMIRAGGYRLNWPHGSRFHIFVDGIERECSWGLLGRPSVYAALAATAVGRELGISVEKSLERLEQLPPTPDRLQLLHLAGGISIISDAYKSPEETIHAALEVLAEVPAKRKIVVLGRINEPRHPIREKYRNVAAKAAAIADLFLLVDSFKEFKAGLNAAGVKQEVRVHCKGPPEAIDFLRRELKDGDVVLVKGRSDQRLERVSMALAGERINCRRNLCPTSRISCRDCPLC